MSSKSGYTKLVRQSVGAAVYRSIWKKDDHLLLVSSNGYVERYQRFQYADIRTFLVLPSERNAYWAWSWTALTLISAIFAGSAIWRGDTPFVSAPFALLFLIGLLWNYVLGPSCQLYLVTRIQTLRLPVHRRRRAERFLEQIGPEIAAAQTVPVDPNESSTADLPPSIS